MRLPANFSMLLSLTLLALIPAAIPVKTVWAQSPENDMNDVSTLNVRGSAEVRAAPDEATVRLGVLAQELTARAAQSRANEIASAILRGLTALEIPESEIQTSELRLHPVFAPQPQPRSTREEPEEPRIVAYRATNVVSVRLTDLDKVGPAIDAGLEAGSNQLQGVEFGLQDDLPTREEALRLAVKEARSKAQALAEALEVELASVLEVNEGGVSVRMPRFADNVAMMRAEAASIGTPVAAGQIVVSAEVSIRYRIE